MDREIFTIDSVRDMDENALFKKYVLFTLLSDSAEKSGIQSDIDYCEQNLSVFEDRLINDYGWDADRFVQEYETYMGILREEDVNYLDQDDVDILALADYNGVSPVLVGQYMNMSVSERETTPCFKSVLTTETEGIASDDRWDDPGDNETGKVLNEGLSTQCSITRNSNGTYHCESDYLGSFDYNPDEWAIGYKEIPGTESENSDGSLTKVPVFKCIADIKGDQGHAAGFEKGFNLDVFNLFGTGGLAGMNRHEQIRIPNGVKVLDYTFEGNDELQLIPGFPDSVVSAHCCFKDCSALHGGSREFKEGESWFDNSGGHWGLSENFEDMSFMFMNCEELGNVSIGELPHGLRTIEGMMYGCSQVQDEKWSGIENVLFGWYMGRGVLGADYSNCPYLMSCFANPVNNDTSNVFKKNAETEYAELVDVQENMDVGSRSDVSADLYEEAVAASVADKSMDVLDGIDNVRDLETMSIDLKENEAGANVQKWIINIATGLGLKVGSSLFTDSKFAQWTIAIGGTALLRKGGVLGDSIEPLLEKVKDMLPDGVVKTFMQGFIDKIHVPSKEERERALAEQFDRYRPLALQDSYERGVKSGEGMDITRWMFVNGSSVVSHGVMLDVGKDGYESANAIGDVMGGVCSGMDDLFTAWSSDGSYSDSERQAKMRKVVMNEWDGIVAYNSGAVAQISTTYSDNEDERLLAEKGLGYVNQQSVSNFMDFVLEADSQYHFLTDEDRQHFADSKLVGVDMSSYGFSPSVSDVQVDKSVRKSKIETFGVPFDGQYDEDSYDAEADNQYDS